MTVPSSRGGSRVWRQLRLGEVRVARWPTSGEGKLARLRPVGLVCCEIAVAVPLIPPNGGCVIAAPLVSKTNTSH